MSEAPAPFPRPRDLGPAMLRFLAWFPVVVVPLFGIGLALHATHAVTYILLMENSLVEQATFLAFMAGAFVAWRYAWRLARHRAPALQSRFFALLGALSFLGGMEEVAWTQTLLDFATPFGLRNVNEQGELTIHNLPGIQDLNAVLLMVFGIVALLAIATRRSRRWRAIAASPRLRPWALVIAITGAACVIVDVFYINMTFDLIVGMLSEVVELLIGMFLFLYPVMHARDPLVHGAATDDAPAA